MSDDDQGRIVAKNANGPTHRGRPPRQNYIDNSERDKDIVTDYIVHRLTLREIGEKHGISLGRVSQIVLEQRQRNAIDHNALRMKSLTILEEIQRRQLEIAAMLPAPVTVGKDGVILRDPEVVGDDGLPAVVRDYAAALKALADAVRTDEALAKRFGLDAATKAEVSQTVRYEVVGIATEDLT